MVDETGEVDKSRVHHAGSQSIILRGKHTNVVFRMDCTPPKVRSSVQSIISIGLFTLRLTPGYQMIHDSAYPGFRMTQG